MEEEKPLKKWLGGGRNNGIGEVKDLRGRLIDGGKLEVMRRYSEFRSWVTGQGGVLSQEILISLQCYM